MWRDTQKPSSAKATEGQRLVLLTKFVLVLLCPTFGEVIFAPFLARLRAGFLFSLADLYGEGTGDERGDEERRKTVTQKGRENGGPAKRRKVCAIPICPPAAGRICPARAGLLWLALAFY